MPETFLLQLKSRRMVTPTILHLEFTAHDNKPIVFIPGQFITFHFELDGDHYNRSYSIASIAQETDAIEVAVSPFQGGPGTRKLFGLAPGDFIQTSGPFGRLILRDEPVKRYILIATGTGVTPYRAMLPQLVERISSNNTEATILLGVQSPEELLYGTDFLEYAHKSSGLSFHCFYSRMMPQHPQPYEHKGYVHTAFEWLQLNPESDMIFLCGNPNMIDEAFETLKAKGFETSKIRREKYISPKR